MRWPSRWPIQRNLRLTLIGSTTTSRSLRAARAKAEALDRVDPERFHEALDSPELWKRFATDMELVHQRGIASVPQLFIERGQFYGSVNAQRLEQLLAGEFGWQSELPVRDGSDVSLVVISGLLVEEAKLGNRLEDQGKYAEALKQYEKALRLNPDWPWVAMRLAWVLATCPDDSLRDGQRTVHLTENVEKNATKFTPQMFDTLAAAYAEAGRFDDAIKAGQQAVDLFLQAQSKQAQSKQAQSKQAQSKQLAAKAQQRIDGYKKGEPHRTKTNADD